VSDLLQAVYRGDDAARDAILATRAPETVFEAAAVGDTRLLDDLLTDPAAVADDGFTALHLAAFFRHPDAVRLLVGRSAPVNAVAANPTRVQPLHSAAAGGDPECVRLLVAAGADVDARQQGGFVPLHASAQNGDLAAVETLLAAGADASVATDDGRTALDLAREAGQDAVVARLSG
jgi:ankyrin repeat protein